MGEGLGHASRDRHLFGPGPKRILSLDGGGVRGVISVAFLERIEAILTEQAGREVRLGDYFDLVGGTSTGARHRSRPGRSSRASRTPVMRISGSESLLAALTAF